MSKSSPSLLGILGELKPKMSKMFTTQLGEEKQT